MLSLTKLALVAVVVLAVAAFARQKRAHRARAAARRPAARGEVADLVRCPRCGVHHAAGDGHVCDESTRPKS